MKYALARVVLLAASLTCARAADVWGRAPEAKDDRFTNPKGTLYAGPDGWWNFGEVRAVVENSAHTAYAYKNTFKIISHEFVSVENLLTLHFDFGDAGLPTPGVYQVSAQGSLAGKKVRLSFADVSGHAIKEWNSGEGAGTLTVSMVHGFAYFTCRNVALQPSMVSNKREFAKPMTLGFEGALSPSEVASLADN